MERTRQRLLQDAAGHYAAGRLAEAAAALREVVRLDPADAETVANLGAILRRLGRPEAALAVYDAGLATDPSAVVVLANRANLLTDLRRWGEALASAERALALAPGHAAAHNARGNALLGLGRPSEALAAFERSDEAATLNRAIALLDLDRPAEALAAAEQAIAQRPGAAKPLVVNGHALAALRRWRDAAAAYDAAIALDPEQPYLPGHRLYARMKTCEWAEFGEAVADLTARIDAGGLAAPPFVLVGLPVSAARQRRYAETYMAATSAAVRSTEAPPPAGRIRVGYFSADFHDHATAHLLAEVIELHDRARFDVTAFSFGPDTGDAMRARLQAGFERFYDVRRLGDADVAAMARGLGLDLAVDLKGLTTGSRPEIFAHGAAPVQASYLGYPMTMGAPFIDYIIADRALIPEPDAGLYTEQVAWLPHCYQPNDRRRPVGPPTTRADHGLPDGAFVFASFNASYKITPEVFDLWMRLLAELSQARLWLLADDSQAAANLRAEARRRGVDPARLVFAPPAPSPQHLERQRHADLFLDTFPCSAHTTASDALRAGLPLLTRRGDTFAGRVAASLLTAAGLADMVASGADDYLARARDLARDPARLRDLRRRTLEAREASPVFDTPAQVRALEDLYARMHARRLAGQPPARLG